MRKLTYFVGMSIDGFIAAPDGTHDFYPVSESLVKDFFIGEYPECLPTHVRQHLGVDDLENRHFDTMLQGRATYDAALEAGITSPYKHLRQYVVSRSVDKAIDPEVEVVSGDVAAKVRELKQEESGLGIYLAGGANLAAQLMEEIDELVLKVYPIVVGSGVPVFSAEFRVFDFELESTRSFDNGTLVLTYSKKR
ncbi:deaminase [Streptomyces agglomeratus]|uniref:Deaminase n=1 Tax=Streptomyces agglomeratus TaxID=285458 RepID=A0A1E5P6A3_9ACTN|nr:dihydrofolate reductase family protein [Streptomyces agglomeratus]OEJ25076.1 deaminase [Streptomyces agglomeratus]OEJ40899.1 deaminase [Streptomyces agglomeratus]OEJ44723.1 deaminase [Streptomyces agglomeratus]OEJ53435.1 deaminase [Streptomyces agglomeratus]OEJ60775.1 deaminase [Streptomyces agglomeratus]